MPDMKIRWEISVTTIAVIFGMAVQGALGVWWFSADSTAKDSRLNTHDARIANVEMEIRNQRNERNDFSERMVRVETQLDGLAKQSSEQRQLLQTILSELRNSQK